MNKSKRLLILAAVLAFSSNSAFAADEIKLQIRPEVIDGPASNADRAAWLAEMTRWRDAERKPDS